MTNYVNIIKKKTNISIIKENFEGKNWSVAKFIKAHLVVCDQGRNNFLEHGLSGGCFTNFIVASNTCEWFIGKVTRKVVKQTVMTVVYGVTFVGGRLQIEKQLKDLNVSEEIIFRASVYVVQEVFKSLAQMFTSARQIQVSLLFLSIIWLPYGQLWAIIKEASLTRC